MLKELILMIFRIYFWKRLLTYMGWIGENNESKEIILCGLGWAKNNLLQPNILFYNKFRLKAQACTSTCEFKLKAYFA